MYALTRDDDFTFMTCETSRGDSTSMSQFLFMFNIEYYNSRTECCALSAPQLFLGSQRFERALDQSERRIRQMPRAERRTPRAGARGHPPARATSGACGKVTRVCPGRGAPIFASGRRHGAGEVARRGVYVTFLAHGYSCATRAVFLTRQTRARRRALTTRGTRVGRSARGTRPTATVATFAVRIRVDLARRVRRSRRDGGRDLFGAYYPFCRQRFLERG